MIYLLCFGLLEVLFTGIVLVCVVIVLRLIAGAVKKSKWSANKQLLSDMPDNEGVVLYELDLTSGVFFDQSDAWILVNGGSYLMGCPATEYQKYIVETATDVESLMDIEEKINSLEAESIYPDIQHAVRLGDFYLKQQLVTLGEFEQFVMATAYQTDAEKAGGSRCWNGKEWIEKAGVNWRQDAEGNKQFDKKQPVVHVSWNDAVAFCNWLGNKYGNFYRLPTEAEWEYACRAGSTTAFNTGENLTTDQANYNGRYPLPGFPKGKYLGGTSPVGAYPPNAYGLYDMHGNVWEWCSDWYGPDYYQVCKTKGEVVNPAGPEEGTALILRGGSWDSVAELCRSAYRLWAHPGFRLGNTGFRVVREMGQSQPS